jgi:hypothetical protein
MHSRRAGRDGMTPASRRPARSARLTALSHADTNTSSARISMREMEYSLTLSRPCRRSPSSIFHLSGRKSDRRLGAEVGQDNLCPGTHIRGSYVARTCRSPVVPWSCGSISGAGDLGGPPGIGTRESARGPFAKEAVAGTGAWSPGEGMSSAAGEPRPSSGRCRAGALITGGRRRCLPASEAGAGSV